MTDSLNSGGTGELPTSEAMNANVHSAYFHYLKYDTQSGRQILSYEYFNIFDTLGTLDEIIAHLLENHHGDRDLPRPYSDTIENLFWRRQGYVIFAVEGRTFHPSHPVSFTVSATSYNKYGWGDGAHTFHPLGTRAAQYDGKDISVAVYGNGMRCKAHSGELGEKEWEEFKLTFAFESEGRRITDDSGGTNMGPPPPPPLVGPPNREAQEKRGQTGSAASEDRST